MYNLPGILFLYIVHYLPILPLHVRKITYQIKKSQFYSKQNINV